MKIVISQSWQFRTYSIQAKCKCIDCGKFITKTFSFEVREDVSSSKEDWNKLEKKKQEWLSQPHICNSCKKKKIQQERKNITSNFTFMFNKLDELQNQINKIVKDKAERVNSLKEIEGKVLVDKNKNEWLIYRIREGSQNNIGFELECYRVNKQKPWLTVDECKYFTNNQTSWYNYISLQDCIITDEIFSHRLDSLYEKI